MFTFLSILIYSVNRDHKSLALFFIFGASRLVCISLCSVFLYLSYPTIPDGDSGKQLLACETSVCKQSISVNSLCIVGLQKSAG